DEPAPARAELTRGGGLQLLLELIEGAERRVDGLGEPTGRRAVTAGPHDVPEERVVDEAAAIVANRGADRLGHGIEIGEQLLGRLVVKRRMPLERFVEDRKS